MPLVKNLDKKYTYDDYKTWSDDERWEIIDGIAYDMTPAPRVKHQRIAGRLYSRLSEKTAAKNCETFIAPTYVVFDDENVVQPDIFVVCDENKITEDNIKGAPDLVIEIVSKSTELKDRREKLKLYERFGVKEYIIIFPEREYAERYTLENNIYGAPDIFNWDEKLRLRTFDIEINLWDIFEKKVESEKDET